MTQDLKGPKLARDLATHLEEAREEEEIGASPVHEILRVAPKWLPKTLAARTETRGDNRKDGLFSVALPHCLKLS